MKENGLLSLINSLLLAFDVYLDCLSAGLHLLYFNSLLALRKAEKEEEKRAREKIRQKLEEDKV